MSQPDPAHHDKARKGSDADLLFFLVHSRTSTSNSSISHPGGAMSPDRAVSSSEYGLGD